MKKPKLPRPEPMELATLAAILCPNAESEVAMSRLAEISKSTGEIVCDGWANDEG